jgi:hypothetical protein
VDEDTYSSILFNECTSFLKVFLKTVDIGWVKSFYVGLDCL